MAQEEKQAQYAGMPRSAINTGLVDFILPVEKMPEELIKYVQHPYIGGPDKIGTPEQQFQNYLQKTPTYPRIVSKHYPTSISHRKIRHMQSDEKHAT